MATTTATIVSQQRDETVKFPHGREYEDRRLWFEMMRIWSSDYASSSQLQRFLGLVILNSGPHQEVRNQAISLRHTATVPSQNTIQNESEAAYRSRLVTWVNSEILGEIEKSFGLVTVDLKSRWRSCVQNAARWYQPVNERGERVRDFSTADILRGWKQLLVMANRDGYSPPEEDKVAILKSLISPEVMRHLVSSHPAATLDGYNTLVKAVEERLEKLAPTKDSECRLMKVLYPLNGQPPSVGNSPIPPAAERGQKSKETGQRNSEVHFQVKSQAEVAALSSRAKSRYRKAFEKSQSRGGGKFGGSHQSRWERQSQDSKSEVLGRSTQSSAKQPNRGGATSSFPRGNTRGRGKAFLAEAIARAVSQVLENDRSGGVAFANTDVQSEHSGVASVKGLLETCSQQEFEELGELYLASQARRAAVSEERGVDTAFMLRSVASFLGIGGTSPTPRRAPVRAATPPPSAPRYPELSPPSPPADEEPEPLPGSVRVFTETDLQDLGSDAEDLPVIQGPRRPTRRSFRKQSTATLALSWRRVSQGDRELLRQAGYGGSDRGRSDFIVFAGDADLEQRVENSVRGWDGARLDDGRLVKFATLGLLRALRATRVADRGGETKGDGAGAGSRENPVKIEITVAGPALLTVSTDPQRDRALMNRDTTLMSRAPRSGASWGYPDPQCRPQGLCSPSIAARHALCWWRETRCTTAAETNHKSFVSAILAAQVDTPSGGRKEVRWISTVSASPSAEFLVPAGDISFRKGTAGLRVLGVGEVPRGALERRPVVAKERHVECVLPRRQKDGDGEIYRFSSQAPFHPLPNAGHRLPERERLREISRWAQPSRSQQIAFLIASRLRPTSLALSDE